MSRKANAPFTAESLKHVAIDNVTARVLETAMRTVAGLTVSDDDTAFIASHLDTVSALWAKFKQHRTAFESLDLFAAMQAATPAKLPVQEPVLNGVAAH